MNLYRLDAPSGPLCDLLGPRLIRSYRRAMDVAHEHATSANETVAVTRISGAGSLKQIATVQPGRGHIGSA